MNDPGKQLPPLPSKGKRGFLWLLVALAPAVLAHIVIFVAVDRHAAAADFWVFLSVGLLVAGGVLSGVLIVKAIKRGNQGINTFVLAILAFVITASYVAAFFFTGCFLILAAG